MENTHLCFTGAWWRSNLAETFFPTPMTRRANLTSLQGEKNKGLESRKLSILDKADQSQDQTQVPPIRQPLWQS